MSVLHWNVKQHYVQLGEGYDVIASIHLQWQGPGNHQDELSAC